MASIASLKVNHQPTDIPGLHVQDAPLSVVERMQELAETDGAGEGEVVLFMFENLICAEGRHQVRGREHLGRREGSRHTHRPQDHGRGEGRAGR